MKNRMTTMLTIAAAALCASSGAAWACTPQSMKAGWVPGHWEWQGNGHVWVPGHATLPRSAYAAHDEDVALLVRDAAHDRDQRDAREQPRDLDRGLPR
jgi:hypothetical protein